MAETISPKVDLTLAATTRIYGETLTMEFCVSEEDKTFCYRYPGIETSRIGPDDVDPYPFMPFNVHVEDTSDFVNLDSVFDQMTFSEEAVEDLRGDFWTLVDEAKVLLKKFADLSKRFPKDCWDKAGVVPGEET